MKTELKALSPKDAVEYYPALGCAGSLANMRCKKIGPKFFKAGKKVIYRPEDIEAFLFQNPVQTIIKEYQGRMLAAALPLRCWIIELQPATTKKEARAMKDFYIRKFQAINGQ